MHVQPAGGGQGPLDFLRSNPQFQGLRQIVQSNPQILQPMLQVHLPAHLPSKFGRIW